MLVFRVNILHTYTCGMYEKVYAAGFLYLYTN